jgi:serine/threonine protein kinase
MAASEQVEEPVPVGPAVRPEPDFTGTTIDRYRLLRRLGVGGMGAVYEVEHVQLHKRFALKMLREELSRTELFRRRFLREARAASAVNHPHVVDISDFGETPDGRVYFVMELLEGRDLQDLLEAEGRLSWPRTQEILVQVAGALEAAHRQGVIHRDVKPSNCFLVELPDQGSEVFVKVLDFGIAKVSGSVDKSTAQLTSTQEIFGTIAYMAPEMAMGVNDEPRSDVYALGVMMYRMLVGELPFTEGNPFQILSQHVSSPPPPPRGKQPSIPEGVEAIILKAMAKDPNHRFSSMGELGRALRRGSLEGSDVALETTMLAGRPMELAASALGVDKTTPLPSILSDSGRGMVVQGPISGGIMGTSAGCETGGTAVVEPTPPPRPAEPGVAIPVVEPELVEPTPPGGDTPGIDNSLVGPEPSGSMRAPQRSSAELEISSALVGAAPKQRKRFSPWYVLPVLGLASSIGVGIFLLARSGEEPAAVAAVEPAPEPSPRRQQDAEPSVAPTELEPMARAVDAKQLLEQGAPSGDAAAEPTKPPSELEPAPSPEPAPTSEPVPPSEPTEASQPERSSPPKPPKHKPAAKPKTDQQVVKALKARIVAKCKEKGGTMVRIEGVISSTGLVASPLITPSTGPGACAKKLVLAAKFDRAGGVRPMPRFSVEL